MDFSHELLSEIIRRGIEAGLARKFYVSCAVVDGAGRTRGVIRHEKAAYLTPEFALGKARLASAYRTSTGLMFARLQKDRPLYGATIASLNAQNQWLLAEGGAAIKLDNTPGESHEGECLGGIGIAGCFPATVDQEVADEIVAWLKNEIASGGR
jgi:uncharacterized protein GlcG (DUF336 family)